MTHEITQADKVAAEGWAREQSPGLQMMLVKPRGLHEAFAAHRSTHEAPLLAENERLRDKEGLLEARLTRAEKVIAVQGNVSALVRELSLEGAEPKPGR